MPGHGICLRAVQHRFERLVAFRVRLPLFGRHIYLTAEFCIHPARTLVFLRLFLFNVIPFSSHTLIFFQISFLLYNITSQRFLFIYRYSLSMRLMMMSRLMYRLKPIFLSENILFFILLKSYIVNSTYRMRTTVVMPRCRYDRSIKKLISDAKIRTSSATNKYLPQCVMSLTKK